MLDEQAACHGPLGSDAREPGSAAVLGRLPPVLDSGQRMARQTIFQLTHAAWRSRCLHAVVRLGVADAIGDQARSYEEVAEAVGADVQALKRVLRSLAAVGVFRDWDTSIGHSEASRLLRTDHPSMIDSVVKWAGSPIQWRAYGELEQVLRTGRSALGPEGLFGFLAAEPGEADDFDRSMEAISRRQVEAIVAAYDFSTFRTVCDVGGGRGHLLLAILAATPRVTGLLVDLPSVVERLDAPTSGRIAYAPCDILSEPPPSADAYVLKNVLHDWSDEDAVRILDNVRASMSPTAKILIVEALLPDPPTPSPVLMNDVAMLVLNDGRERTLRDFESLCDRAGLRCVSMVSTPDISIVVAERAR